MAIVKQTYHITGMTCAACASSTNQALSKVKGVKNAEVNYANSSATIELDEDTVSFEKLKKSLNDAGYGLVREQELESEEFVLKEQARLKKIKIKTFSAILLATPVAISGMFFHHVSGLNWFMLVLTIPIVFWAGNSFFINAWKRTLHFTATMDTLVATGTGVAFIYSTLNTVFPENFLKQGLETHVYFEASAVVIALVLLGKFLEERAKFKTSGAIRKLMSLTPKTAIVIRNGAEIEIPVSEVFVGDRIIIKPGATIPADGKVMKGFSFVDESMISGESIPVEKNKGDKLTGGTINQSGSLVMIAQNVGNETVLSQIIRMIKDAQASKAPVQKLADQIASVFVPIVLVVAIISSLIWYFWGPIPSLPYAITVGVSILVIACPCALGLATPTALIVGLGKAASNGILIRNAEVLETTQKLNAIVLDKTGTLTIGKPEVSDFYIDSLFADKELIINYIYALEKLSEHPLAKAILQYFKDVKTLDFSIEQFQSFGGQGVSGKIGNLQLLTGNHRFISENKISISDELQQKVELYLSDAKTLVFFAVEKQVAAIVSISDQIRETAFPAIRHLQKNGIEVHMLTGDNESSAKMVATKLGIKKYKSEVLPADKLNYVKNLQQSGWTVAMAGDGINDAPAIAQANIGFALASGTEIAVESADIILIKGDLEKISMAIEISGLTIKTIRQNLFWAFFYNIIGIPLAAGILFPFTGILLNPMIAGAAMAFSSISVVSNSLLLRTKKVASNMLN